MKRSTFVVSVFLLAWIYQTKAQSVKGYPDELDVPFNKKCNDTSCMPPPTPKPKWEDKANAAPPGVNDKTHEKDEDRDRHPYERDGKYWLVPPFLIGACSVIVMYIFVHCVYLHCYAKKRLRKLQSRPYPPAIVISDDPTSTNSYQPYTPVVKYEGAYGQTELHPFLLCHPFDDNEWERQLEQRRRSSVRSIRKKSSFSLQIPKFFGQQRPSVCSAGAVLDQSSSPTDQDVPKLDSRRPTRASICFLPVGRTLSEPSAANADWSQLPAYMFPSVLMPNGQLADGAPPSPAPAPADGEGQTFPTPPIIVIRRPSTQINLPVPTLGVQPSPPTQSAAPTAAKGANVTSAPKVTSNASSNSSNQSIAGTTAATIHAEPSSNKVNGSVKPEVQVTFHLEDCSDSGSPAIEIPLQEIKEETHES